jgi:hypothetical protein
VEADLIIPCAALVGTMAGAYLAHRRNQDAIASLPDGPTLEEFHADAEAEADERRALDANIPRNAREWSEVLHGDH